MVYVCCSQNILQDEDLQQVSSSCEVDDKHLNRGSCDVVPEFNVTIEKNKNLDSDCTLTEDFLIRMLKNALTKNATRNSNSVEVTYHHGIEPSITTKFKRFDAHKSSSTSITEAVASSFSYSINSIEDESNVSQSLGAYPKEEDARNPAPKAMFHDHADIKVSNVKNEEGWKPELLSPIASDLMENEADTALLNEKRQSSTPITKTVFSGDAVAPTQNCKSLRFALSTKAPGNDSESNEVHFIAKGNEKEGQDADITQTFMCDKSDASEMHNITHISALNKPKKFELSDEIHVNPPELLNVHSIDAALQKPNVTGEKMSTESHRKVCANDTLQTLKEYFFIQLAKSECKDANSQSDKGMFQFEFLKPNSVQLRLYDLSKKLQEEGKALRKRAGKKLVEKKSEVGKIIMKPNRAQIRLYNRSKNLQTLGKERRKEAAHFRTAEDREVLGAANRLSKRALCAMPNAAQIRLFMHSKKRQDERKRQMLQLLSRDTKEDAKFDHTIKPNRAHIRLYNASKHLQELGKERRRKVEEHSISHGDNSCLSDRALRAMPNAAQIRLYTHSKQLQEKRKKEMHAKEITETKLDGKRLEILKPSHAQIRLYNKSNRLQELGKVRRKDILNQKKMSGCAKRGDNSIFSEKAQHAKPNAAQIRLYRQSQSSQEDGRKRRKLVTERISQNFPERPFQIRRKPELVMGESKSHGVRKKYTNTRYQKYFAVTNDKQVTAE